MSHDVTPTGTLTSKQETAITALLSSPSIEEAAKKTGVTGRTLLRWLTQPEFEKAYRQARREATQHAVALLQRSSGAAVTVLLKIAADKDAPASSRVSAASKILDMAFRATELEDVTARIEALEEQLGDQEPK